MPSYAASQDAMRMLASAAKLRDWNAIDRILEEQVLRGNESVMNGFRDAINPDVLPALDKPNIVTIHDLPNCDAIEVVGTGKGDVRQWRPKKAA